MTDTLQKAPQQASQGKKLRDRLRARLREFRTASGANVTLTFALATLPIVGFVGAAVDYSHANQVRTAMQAAADSTALMLSKDASSLTNGQLQTKANDYFKALFTRTDAIGLTVVATYKSSSGSQVTVNATSKVGTEFMGIMGFSSLQLAVESQVKWGNARLRVALALDNTGSMSSDGKMTALKAATKGLLTQLKNAAAKNGDVYVSIIPFSKDVNVGKSNYNQPWVDFDDHPGYDGWDSENGDDVSTKVCTGSSGKKKKCTISTTWVPDDHNTWNGCVTDRDIPYDIQNTAPTVSNTATLFPAEQYSSCPTSLLALTYDWTALNSKVDAMSPSGNTNQTIGLAWAFQSLTASPFTIPVKDPNFKYSEVIILLTDGLNTQNRFSSSQSAIDARQKLLCENVKKAGITIYTVQVNTGGDPTQDVLKKCASDSSKFFELKSSNQLVTTFNSIGTALSNLRIAE